MRKFFTVFCFFLLAGAAHAESQVSSSAFACMDKQSFEIDSNCMQTKISSNKHFAEMQQSFEAKISQPSDNAIATLRFYPEKRLIEVMAKTDKKAKDNLVASTAQY